MVTICQRCGDRGFDVALIHCAKCQAYAVHRYCFDVLPATSDEHVVWLCYDCESKTVKSSSLDKPGSPIVKESDCDSLKIIQLKKSSRVKRPKRISKMKVADCPLTKSDLLRPQICPSFQLVEVDCCENGEKDQEFGRKNELHEDGVDDFPESVGNKHAEWALQNLEKSKSLEESGFHEEAESLKTNSLQLAICDVKPLQIHFCEDGEKNQELRGQDDLNGGNFVKEDDSDKTKVAICDAPDFAEQKRSVLVQPIRDPTWRGSMNIFYKDYGTLGGIVAHLSSIACSRVSEAAKTLPRLLAPELLPRTVAWPKSFRKGGPNPEHIALYIFPDSARNEMIFDSLVNDMIDDDLAMRSPVKNAELLIYTSRILPVDYWRFRAKFYLWGVFRGKQPSAMAMGFVPGKEQSLAKAMTWDRQSPVSPFSNVSNGSGSM